MKRWLISMVVVSLHQCHPCHADQLTIVRSHQPVAISDRTNEISAIQPGVAAYQVSPALLFAATEYTPIGQQYDICSDLRPPVGVSGPITEKSPAVLLAGASGRIKIQPYRSGIPQDLSVDSNSVPVIPAAFFYSRQPIIVPVTLDIIVYDHYIAGVTYTHWAYTAHYNGQLVQGYGAAAVVPEQILPNYRQSVTPQIDCNIIVQDPVYLVLDPAGNATYTPITYTTSPCSPSGSKGDACTCDNTWTFSVPWDLNLAGGLLPLSAGITITPAYVDIVLPPTDTRLLSGKTGFIYISNASAADGSIVSSLFIPTEIRPTVTEAPL